MKRRDFLRNSSALSLPAFVNGFGLKAIGRNILSEAVGQTDKVLVLIQLNGGNDGLNMIIPLDQYDQLQNYRSNLLIPSSQVLKIDETVGFHPAMSGCKNLFDDAKMRIIQGVAYPNQNRSHFRSTDIWSSGSDAAVQKDTGWLGTYFDDQYPDFPEAYPDAENPDPFALTIGAVVSETCQGKSGNFSLALNDPFSLSQLGETESGSIPDTNYGAELKFLIEAIKQTNAYSETITAAAENGSNLSALYPDDNRLAQQLKTVALLISGGLKTNVYVVQLGGFDTHANQTNGDSPVQGIHAELLSDLSEAIGAFQDDLGKLGVADKVLGMTFSEFGRQIGSNDSFGTDHGTAAPMILFGNCVEAGILGSNPQIGGQIDPQEGVAMQYDFRSVYASVLVDWFGISRADVEEMFFPEVQQLSLIAEGCAMTTGSFIPDPFIDSMKVFPNPMENYIKIEVGVVSDDYRLSLFDHLGHELNVINNGRLYTGKHQFHVITSHLPAGSYILRLSGRNAQMIKKIVKL